MWQMTAWFYILVSHRTIAPIQSINAKWEYEVVLYLSVGFLSAVSDPLRNSKSLGKPSGDSWQPIPWCWTSTASSCWIRAGMLLGLPTGRSASSTLMSKHTHIHKHERIMQQQLRGNTIAARICVNLTLGCQSLLLCALARPLFEILFKLNCFLYQQPNKKQHVLSQQTDG